MSGITTALVVFMLIAVAFPVMIRSKAQFFIAVGFVAMAIILSPFAFNTFCAFIVAVLQMLAFIALVLCTGGLNLHELAEQMVGAYGALLYGEDAGRPVIVPRTGSPAGAPGESEKTASGAVIIPPAPVQASIPLDPPSAPADGSGDV